MKNTGTFNLEKLQKESLLVRSLGKKTKEHNGDYLNINEIKIRFQNGLDSLNIGPEIAQIETLTYLDNMTSEQIDEYYQICLDSKKWERWVGEDFDFDNKRKLIQVCGHYCFGQYNLPKIDDIVKKNIKRKLTHLP